MNKRRLRTSYYVHVIETKFGHFICDCPAFRACGQQCSHIKLIELNLLDDSNAIKIQEEGNQL